MALETIIFPAAPPLTSFDSDRPAPSYAWTKRKRSRRSLPFHPRSEDKCLALRLVMLAHAHKASHKEVSSGSSSASAEGDVNDPGISSTSSLCGKGRSHECSICGRSFVSGQALGGHKRSHFDKSGGMRVKGIGVSVSETSGRRCYDFDLNLLPPGEEEEMEVECPHPSKKARLSTATEAKSEAEA